jgi:dolichol-phosphate mannosyltransferase
MMNKPLSFAIVLPMYNEEDCAERAIRSIAPVLDEFENPTYIIAVNDGSYDNTKSIVEGLLLEFPYLILLNHKANQGYGGAVKTAMNYAITHNLDYLLFMDSDLTQDPKYIACFVPKMQEGYAMIKGSRYVKGGAVRNVPLHRQVISLLGNWLAKVLFRLPIRDYTNGFRCISTNLAKQLALESRGFEVLLEELYQAKFVTQSFCEIPYVLTARSNSDGSSTFTYTPQIFVRYLKFAAKSFFRIRPEHLRE